GGHHDQDRHAVDLVRHRAVVIEIHGAPRTAKMSFGVDPSDGPEDAIYSTPLMLRWIARCTSDWIRSGIDARSRPAGALILVLLRAIDNRQLSAAVHRQGSMLRSARFECFATPAATWPWQEAATSRTR